MYTRPAGHMPLASLFQTHLPTHLIPISDGVPVWCQIFLYNLKSVSLWAEGTQGVVVPGRGTATHVSKGNMQRTFDFVT
jgi:hypothetical protein